MIFIVMKGVVASGRLYPGPLVPTLGVQVGYSGIKSGKMVKL